MAKSAKNRAQRVQKSKVSEAEAQRIPGPVEERLVDRQGEQSPPTVLVLSTSNDIPDHKGTDQFHGFHIIVTWLALVVFGYEKWPHLMEALTTLSTFEKYGLCVAAYLVGRPVVNNLRRAWAIWREEKR